MITIIFVISVILSYLFAFRQIYQLQVTEYRFDRFMAMLHDSGYASFFLPKIVFPAKTVRNIMIAVLALFIFLLLNYFFITFFSDNLTLVLVFAFLNYFIIKDLVFLSSLIVSPFANMSRKKRIEEARSIVKNSNAEIIGVTGSFGKSSVKEFVYQILKEKYNLERTSGNRNTDIGVAIEIKEKLKKDLDYFVCEMGAYKIGEIEKIAGFVYPKYGILTGIGNQHMDLFKNIHNLVRAKSELLKSLPEDGVAIINIDNNYKEKLLEGLKAKPITYGWDEKADYRLIDLKYRGRLMFVNFSAFGKNYKFTTALLGEHQAINLLGVIALALELKVSYEVIQRAIAKMEPLESKLSLHLGINNSTILNDGYNSNLDGFLSAINVAKNFDAKKKYAFSYGIFELGSERKKAYEKIVNAISDADIKLLTLDKRFLKLNPEKVIYMKTETEIMDYLSKNLDEGDLFLLQGRCTPAFLSFLDMRKYEIQD